jgi:anaerobic selenocysteine-containing dehydrogenase
VEAEHLSYCRICAAACGITVTVDGSRVVRVRGDAEHPVSRGYTCSKGRGLPEWHHSNRRLDSPRLRGRAASWDDVLGDLADALGGTIETHGPDAVALYLATGLAYDAGGQVAAGMWLGSLRSRSFYSAATVDNAPVLVAAQLVAGNPMLNPVWDPSAPGLLLLVGTNPVVSHGYGTALPDPIRHLRDYRELGGRVWVIDPRRTESAARADEHLAVRPGSDVAVLGAIAAALLEDGADPTELVTPADLETLRHALVPFTVARAAAAGDVDAAAVERLIVDVRAHRGRVAIMCGTGTTMSLDGILVEWMRWVILVLTGSLDRPGGMRFNRGAVHRLQAPSPKLAARPPPDRDRRVAGSGTSNATEATARPRRRKMEGPGSRPELSRVIGQVPSVALADEIEAGNVRSLVITGGNPITAFPEPDRMRAALGQLDTLVVVDVAESELTARATHVLPATGQLERADLSLAEMTAVRSGLQYTAAVLPAVGERRPVWWILATLARHMGGDLLSGADPDDLDDELFLAGLLSRSPLDPAEVIAAGPRGVDIPEEFGWVRDGMLPDGQWRIAPPTLIERLAAHTDPDAGLVLAPRRQMAWSNSIAYAGTADEPVVRINPTDASEAHLEDGALVTITSAHGRLTATMTVDGNVRTGLVSVTHGRVGASPGQLTSSHEDVDLVTAMPQASGVAVTISAGPTNQEERAHG